MDITLGDQKGIKMKHLVKLTVFLGVVLFFISPVWAKGTQGVANTVHNLSTSGISFQYGSTNVDEICVFCHTPHGGVLTGPLWNHSMPAADSFTHYNSATLSDSLRLGEDADRPVNDESLLCMACHDGSVAIDHLINPPNSLNGQPVKLANQVNVKQLPDGDDPWARIGAALGAPLGNGMLGDDHPISFSYDAVWNDPMYQTGSKVGELHDSAAAILAGVRFFRSENNVECSSCHDPHVDYETADLDHKPFLIMSNSGSALCLACHNK